VIFDFLYHFNQPKFGLINSHCNHHLWALTIMNYLYRFINWNNYCKHW